MTIYEELLDILTVPRPNGSQAERDTSRALQGWLEKRGIPFRVQAFRLYPYFFEAIGVWLVASRLLLALAIWLRWGWIALPIAVIGLIGATVDQAFHIPLVTWPGARRGENILLEFEPPNPQREILFSAHYDSKTELLDHRQRMLFLKAIPLGILLTLALGVLGPLDARLLAQDSAWAGFTYRVGVILTLPLLFLASGLGLNMALGRLVKPSQGAVDNGSACAILLGLAERLHTMRRQASGSTGQEFVLETTRVSLALFTGEEADRQGSRAYVSRRGREEGWPLPAVAINLEVMAQNGDYVFWEREGSVFRLRPTGEEVNQAIRRAVAHITGKEPVPGGPVISDGAPFLYAGIPIGVLGAYDRRLKDQGFHRPSDNRERIDTPRLAEGVQILLHLIETYERNDWEGR